MPDLTFVVEDRCVTCGYTQRGRQWSWGCCVNRNSIRVDSSLVWRGGPCRECDQPTASTVPTERVFLDPESDAKVRAIRTKRGWLTDDAA